MGIPGVLAGDGEAVTSVLAQGVVVLDQLLDGRDDSMGLKVGQPEDAGSFGGDDIAVGRGVGEDERFAGGEVFEELEGA